jgi:hypothetical protein
MRRSREQRSGSIILFLIIVIAVIAGGAWFLNDLRRSREAEARAFGREIVERLTVQHDLKFLHSIVPVEHRAEFTPGREEGFINSFTTLGTPEPGWQLAGDVVFENHFFAPVGDFKAILRYPSRFATVSLRVSAPRGPWQLDQLALTWERTPEESQTR